MHYTSKDIAIAACVPDNLQFLQDIRRHRLPIFARKYNGEWILADSPVPFNMEGWIPQNGSQEYEGSLVRNGFIVEASTVSDAFSRVPAGE